MTKQVLSVIIIAAIGVLGAAPAGAAVVTPGYDLYVDASQDPNTGNDRAEDLASGNPSGFEFLLDTTNGVANLTATSVHAGITRAYELPGGFFDNTADSASPGGGLELVDTGTTTRNSFHTAPGDWSDEDVTIELWFKPDDLPVSSPTNGQILFEDGGGTGIGFFVDDSNLRVRQKTGNNGTGDIASDISAITGDFIQAVATLDRVAGNNASTLTLYINGAPAGTPDTNSGNDWSGGDNAALGTRGGENIGGYGDNQQNTESFDGKIAIFRVYRNQVLTAQEVLDNYNATSPAYRREILGDNPVGYWRLGEASTAGGADNIGSSQGGSNPNDGAYAGGVSVPATALIAPSKSGGDTAASFDGTGNGIQVPAETADLNSEKTAYTIDLWFNTTTTTGRQFLYEQGGGTNGIVFYLDGDDLVAGVNDNTVHTNVKIVDEVLADTTYYAALVYDGGTSLKAILKSFDGTQDQSNTNTTGIPALVGGHSGVNGIGAVNGDGNSGARIETGVIGTGSFFSGTLDEVATYDSALSDTEIGNHYTAGIPEPSTLALAAIGLLGLRRKRR